MKSKALSRVASDLSGRPFRTIEADIAELQGYGSIAIGARGRNCGAVMTPSCRINALLGTALSHPRGVPLGESVRAVRSLALSGAFYSPRLRTGTAEDNAVCACQVVEGLALRFDDLGTALDGIISAMETDVWERWTEGVTVNVAVDFHGSNQAMLFFDRPQVSVGAIFAFGDKRSDIEPPVDRIVRLNNGAFERLAKGTT